jgi:hypothetical protein
MSISEIEINKSSSTLFELEIEIDKRIKFNVMLHPKPSREPLNHSRKSLSERRCIWSNIHHVVQMSMHSTGPLLHLTVIDFAISEHNCNACNADDYD